MTPLQAKLSAARAVASCVLCLFMLLFMLASCGDSKPDAGEPSAGGAAKASLPDGYWSASPIEGAMDVTAARKVAKDGQELTVIGLVQDFSKGQAQFFVADRALVPCNERAADSCPTPWDYCCEDKVRFRAGLMTVELRDGKKLRKTSLEGFHGFTHLKEAIVKGKAEVDASGNVVLVASAMHIREATGRKKN